MWALECLADLDPDMGCILMADFWPIANKGFMRHVSDSIDLWLVHHRSPAVVAHLTACPDPEMRTRWLELLANPS